MRFFKELEQIKSFEQLPHRLVEIKQLGEISVGKKKRFPVLALVIGTRDKTLPTFGLFGGVHGLERIGTQVINNYLLTLLNQLRWDRDLCHLLESCRIVSIPLINPGGMYLSKRSNPQGVDLMRNAPFDKDKWSWLLFSGHRLTRLLPWYRGKDSDPPEKEARILIDFVRDEMFFSKMAISLDVHSGFGGKDQLWYPYAKTTRRFPRENQAIALKTLLNQTYPYHVYKVEPQSVNYTAYGDLWDYLFDDHFTQNTFSDRIFLPWTLELGSWRWVWKNPKQLFEVLGIFNPMLNYRRAEAMRKHQILFDFLFRATKNYDSWRVR